MKPLEEIFKGVDLVRGEAEQAEADARQRLAVERESAKAQIRDARERIAAGEETSGSKLHDGLVVVYGEYLVDYPTILENYERVAEGLKGKRGEPVVIVHSWTELEGCTGFGGEAEEVNYTEVTVGVLGGTELIFDYEERNCKLPTSKYAQISSKPYPSEPHVAEGGLEIGGSPFMSHKFDIGPELDRKVDGFTSHFDEEQVPKLIFAAGHDAINEWLSNDSFIAEYSLIKTRKLCEKLGIEPIEPVTDSQRSLIGRYDAQLG